MTVTRRLVTGVALAVTLSTPLVGQERTREAIPDKYKWNLTNLYLSDAAWRAEKDALVPRFGRAKAFTGTLGQSASQLATALAEQAAQEKTLARLFAYANLSADQDTREAAYQGMSDEMTQVAAQYGAAWAFVEPELLTLAPATLESWMAATPELGPYAFALRDVQRRKAHTLSAREEALLAQTLPMASGAETTANILLNADLPWPTVKQASGTEVRLDPSGFSAARAVADRDDRRTAMEAFFGVLGTYRRTIGSTLNSAVQAALFQTRARNYESTVQRVLDGPNLPPSVQSALVDGVNAHLPAFHRYLTLRKRILGVSQLHYYDLYAPLVAGVPLEFTVEQAQDEVKRTSAVLGDDYVQALDRAFMQRWVDYYPTTGKQSGAYVAGYAYDVHPYMLLNFNGQYTDLSTLAHEAGHLMHSYFSSRHQPYPTAGYPTFVAEVASTFNEALLIEQMLGKVTEPKTRLALLGNYLEGVKGTVFRQTQFAEFEMRIHEMAQKGEPLTGDVLSKVYLDITRKYYGHDRQIAVVDDYVAHEWAYITHFYRPFYVFQYATSFTASTALSEKVLAGAPDAVRRFRTFLASGGSKYPVDLLKDAGVDMTTSEPLDLTIRKMNRVMDEMEKLLR